MATWIDGHDVFLNTCKDHAGENLSTAVFNWYNAAHPPNTPLTPSGPTSGYRNVSYVYSTSTIDPNGDYVRYQFELTGPSTNRSSTTGWYESGQTGNITVMWEPSDPLGTYQIRARAQDVNASWSVWSPPLNVTIDNRAPNTPSTPSGPTSGYVGTLYTYSSSATDPDGDNVRYLFDWGDGSNTTTGWYSSGSTAYALHTWDSQGTYDIRVQAQDAYWNWSGWSSYLTVSISTPPDTGGGCPYVSTWDGEKYMLDNNLLPVSGSSGGAEVTDYYLLQQMLVSKPDGTYSLLFNEFENEHSFFDQVQLLAVDHPSNVYVAVSPYGEILTYTTPYPPKSAVDNNNRNVKTLVSSVDGNYYEGYNGSYITLNFGEELDVSQGAKLVLRADRAYKRSIYIQVQDSEGNWLTVATVIPRTNCATEIIDMSRYLPDDKGDLKVRLYFTTNHKLDFVGLDTSPQATINVQAGQLTSATHSSDGDVTTELLFSDETHAELLPGEEIKLAFTLPPQTMEARNYIIIVEGHYYTIET